MNNSTLVIKVKERLNKLDSNDYDSFPSWKIIEAFNKAQVEWCREQLSGINATKTGDEQTKRRIDDLRSLLTEIPVNTVNKGDYYLSDNFPLDYMEFKKVTTKAKKDCCDDRKMIVYLGEEANSSLYLRDDNMKPSFEWGETFVTLVGNNFRLYTNGDFEIYDTKLMYYRLPRYIEIVGIINPYTGQVSTTEVTSEFVDDITELIINHAVLILSGDIESMNQYQIANANKQRN